MKETLERQWPEEMEEHLLAVAGHKHRCKETTQPDGGREEKKNRFCANYCTPQKSHSANSVPDREAAARRGGPTDQKMQEMNVRGWNFKHGRWRELKR